MGVLCVHTSSSRLPPCHHPPRPPLPVPVHITQEESLATLRCLRGEKKAWFEARRKHRQNPGGGGGALVENDRDKALSVVERIIKSAAVVDASRRTNTAVPPSSEPPPLPTTGPPLPPTTTGSSLGRPFENGTAVFPSASRRTIVAHAEESPAGGCGGCSRGKGAVDELRGGVAGLSMARPVVASGMKQGEEEEDEL